MAAPDFIDDVADDLLCGICSDAAGVGGHATVTDACGHLFCEDCILRWLNSGNTTCPVDRQPLIRAGLRKDIRTQRLCQALRVRCDGARSGCSWEGCWSELAAHVAGCGSCKPKVRCALAACGCPAVFGTDIDDAGAAAARAAHNADAVQDHITLLAAHCAKLTTEHGELGALVTQLSRTVARLENDVAAANQRACDADAARESAMRATSTELRTLYDRAAATQCAQPLPAPSSPAFGIPPAVAVEPSFGHFALQTRPGAPAGFANAAGENDAPLLKTAVLQGTGWYTAASSSRLGDDDAATVVFAVRATAPEGAALTPGAVMVGVTLNEGAALHHGRNAHIGNMPGTVCLQSSGFTWVHAGGRAMSAPYEAAPGQPVAYGAGDVVMVAVSMHAACVTAVRFGVNGSWHAPVAGFAGFAGRPFAAVSVLSPAGTALAFVGASEVQAPTAC